MKILRLTTLLDFGGQERKYISFTEKSELLKHQYVFAAIGFGGNAEKILRERGFEVHVLNRNFAIRNLSNLIQVYKFIKSVNPDVVHTAAAEANFFGILAAKLAGVKVIIGEEIGIPNHSAIAKKIFALVYRFADKIVCVSKAVQNYLIQIGEIQEKQAVLIYNPADAPVIEKKESRKTFQIVYVGRLEIVKNVETLIKSFGGLEKGSAHLTIVGDGREKENLEKLVSELSLNEFVEFTGFSNHPHTYLANADVFVLPSFSEGFGIAAVEAMLIKVPVLCSKVGGIPEFVEDGKTGWLFDPKNGQELKRKLNDIQSLNKDELRKIGEKGFQFVNERFTKQKYVENLEKLYNEIKS